MLNSDDAAELNGFLGSLRAAWSAEDRPASAHLDVTYRCDLDCGHCYLDNKTTWPELTTAEWLDVLEQLRDAGVLFAVWSGGDVLMRSDFATLLTRASELGLLSRVKTHGGQIDATWARLFAGSKVIRTDVSVFSLRADIHDALTRNPIPQPAIPDDQSTPVCHRLKQRTKPLRIRRARRAAAK